MRYINKRVIIIASVLIAMALTLIIGMLLTNRTKPDESGASDKPNISATPAVARDVPRGLFESPFPTFTGAQDEMSIPASRVDSIDRKIRLRSETPVSSEWFDLDYDYAAFKFIVSLKQPEDNSRVKFLEWLEESGFGEIPQDEFIFIQ